MNSKEKAPQITRRTFLKISGFTVAGAVLAAGYVLQDTTRDESLVNPAQLFWANPEQHG